MTLDEAINHALVVYWLKELKILREKQISLKKAYREANKRMDNLYSFPRPVCVPTFNSYKNEGFSLSIFYDKNGERKVSVEILEEEIKTAFSIKEFEFLLLGGKE